MQRKQRAKEEVTITNPILDGYNNRVFEYEAEIAISRGRRRGVAPK